MRKFVLIFLFFSCEKLDTLGPNPTGMELSTAMEKWDNKNFNNYEYSLDVLQMENDNARIFFHGQKRLMGT